MKRITTILVIIILTSLCFATCDIALGTKINLFGPTVTITGPEPDRAAVPAQTDPLVNAVFELTGTIESPSKIAEATVNVEYWNGRTIVKMGREWKWEGYWYTRESADYDWKLYERSAYAVEDPKNEIKDPSWDAQQGKVTFSLPIFMTRMESGDYFITVSAWDNAGIHDSESSKKLKFKFSNMAPKLEIKNPKLNPSVASSLSHPKPPSWEHLIFDPFGKPVDTYRNISEFTNDFAGLSWGIVKGMSSEDGKKLKLMITNEHNLDTEEGRIVYFEWDYNEASFGAMPQSGVHNGNDTSQFPTIELDPALEVTLPRNKVTPLQLISVLEDVAKNVEYKSNGWFFYLPDSDNPYPHITFANPVKEGVTPPANICDDKKMFRGDTEPSSRAFDDDGVDVVTYWVSKLVGNTLDVETTYGPVTASLGEAKGNKDLSWPFIANRDWGIGRFKIEVQVTDTKDNVGEKYTAYFTVESNATPAHREFTFANDDTLWGDTNANFTISGKAHIECSDGCTATGKAGHPLSIDEVKIVWINPNDRSQDNVSRYKTPGDALWGFTGDTFTDDRGNKGFKVPAANIGFEAGTAGNKNGYSRENWTYTLTKNWFTDIGISGTSKDANGNQVPLKFENQTFEIRFTSNGEISGVTTLSTIGDRNEPVLTVEHIDFHDKVEWKPIPLSGGNLFPQIPDGAKIKISGTWSDDSIGKWSARTNRLNLVKDFKVEWNGEALKAVMPSPVLTLDTVQVADGGTWTTGEYTFSFAGGAPNTDPFVEIVALLKDLNDGNGRGEKLLNIETDYPTLTRISSTLVDGKYGNYKLTDPDTANSRYIDIFLDFNKTVRFFTGTAPTTTAPKLLLNNGGIAFYRSGGDGGSKINFRYFIDDKLNGPGSIPAATGSVTSTKIDKLNVIGIDWGGYPSGPTNGVWVSTMNPDQKVTFPTDILEGKDNSATPGSFIRQKNIEIDKEHPIITGIASSTSDKLPHGVGSQVRITVTFDEDIKVAAGATATNLFLNLDGGLGTAGYYSAGTRTIDFMYTVKAGDNSAGISVANMVGNNFITDIAGNAVMSSKAGPTPAHNGAVTISYSSNLGRVIKVETRTPNTPDITGIAANTNYYTDTINFRIDTKANASHNSTIQNVEYCLNYTGGSSDEWLTYSGAINSNLTNNIPITINGTYTIAARVLDNATTQNQSAVFSVNNVTLNKGHVLQRITSLNPDGFYGSITGKNEILIDLEFRIPVLLTGTGGASNVTLTMGNVATGGVTTAILQTPAAGNNTKKWTFKYTIDANTTTNNNRLSVTALNFGTNTGISDTAATPANLASMVTVAGVSPSNKFEVQKDIQILTGRPALAGTPSNTVIAVSTTTGGNTPTTANPMRFTQNGAGLSLLFDRDIYRGSTTSKLIVRQIPGTYSATEASNSVFRIPAVLSSDQYTRIFSGRSDIFTNSDLTFAGIWASTTDTAGTARATLWENLGKYLYEQGSNGATETTTTKLTSDTTTKYVLKYTIDTAGDDADSITFGSNTTTMSAVRTVFRAAEALSFGVNDPEVEIVNVSGNPRQLNISFSARGELPVKGARYEVIFPNGFVKDILGKANGGVGTGTDAAPQGKDTNISSAAAATTSARVLNWNTATEVPIIRIDKGNDDHPGYQGSGNFRNIHQPLTTTFKIDARTPGSAITYTTRSTTDNVYRLMNRNGSTNTVNAANYLMLPNMGTQTTQASFVATRLRPQSGDGSGTAWTTATGMDHFTPMAAFGTTTTTGNSGSIGNANYNDGGMEINIKATATANSIAANGYEAAYRSVFIFNNQNQNNANERAFDSYTANTRVWLRGGNSTQGDPTIPDFPISRDPSLGKKVKLMSPIDAAKFVGGTTATLYEASVTNSDVISSDDTDNLRSGRRLWVWVTWRLNEKAFVDMHTGKLPAGETDYPAPAADIMQFFQGFIPQKEHYAIHPGRTTIVESRNTGNQWDGNHGNVIQTSAKDPETYTDLP